MYLYTTSYIRVIVKCLLVSTRYNSLQDRSLFYKVVLNLTTLNLIFSLHYNIELEFNCLDDA